MFKVLDGPIDEIALENTVRTDADGAVIGVTPAHFEVLPAALRVMVGEPEPGAACAWQPLPTARQRS